MDVIFMGLENVVNFANESATGGIEVEMTKGMICSICIGLSALVFTSQLADETTYQIEELRELRGDT